METDTQVPNVASETPAEDKSGVQQRINELTAEKYAAQKQAEQFAAQLQQVNGLVAQLMQQREQPQESIAPIDEDDKKKFDAYLSPLMRRMEQQFAVINRTLTANNVQAVANKYGVSNEVMTEAQKIVRENGTSEQIAVELAVGRLALAGKTVKFAGNGANNALASGNTLNGGSAVGPDVTTTGQAPMPQDFNSWSPSAQIKWFRKHRPGLEDAPIG